MNSPHEGPGLAYLDHAATSPVRPEVVEAMAPFAVDRFANPSGSHRPAREARAALEDAREQVAASLGARPREVVFTSGGTEADNLAVLGAVRAAQARSAHQVIACSAVEHAAVHEPCRALAKESGTPPVEWREIPVDRQGVLDLDALAMMLGDEVTFVSVMLANNEVGTIQPLRAVVDLVGDLAPRALVHSDAVQAVPALDVAALTSGVDLVSVSAHKIGGPKGAGALVVREGVELLPLMWGGGQEHERRSGTENVAGAVGLAAALEVLDHQRRAEVEHVAILRDRLADGLLAAGGVVETVERSRVLPGHCHLLFEGCEQEELLVLLDDAGVCASGGAACASGALEPSRVLLAMGLRPELAAGALRFSLGPTTDAGQVARALEVVPAAAAALRGR